MFTYLFSKKMALRGLVLFGILVIAIVLLTTEKGKGAGLSEIPINLEKLDEATRDNEILRVGIIAELDAINLYEQMAALATNKLVKKTLLDIAREEKTHIGEFQALLLMLDKEQAKEMEEGGKEIEEFQKSSEKK
jgi:rubrerythrin